MLVIADKCPEISVNVVDKNAERIKRWNDKDFKNIPVFEPNLIPILKRTRDRNLFFSTNVSKEIQLADIVFICVNTPTKLEGLGSGRASDLKWIKLCAKEIEKYSEGDTIVVEKSTVPVKTAELIKQILKSPQNSSSSIPKNFSVLSNPEFLSEGNAIRDLLYPDRILIGGEDKKSIDLLSSVYEKWVAKEKIIKTNLWSSELSKLTANAFLAQRISSINSISAVCEVTGADIKEVSRSVGGDSRIGDKFLSAGPGFGGSCFKKDLLNLTYLCEHYNLNEVAAYWNSVLEINNWQQKRISKEVFEKLCKNASNKKISILGFSFKANTNDTRDSPSINICINLIEQGAFLNIHDPKVTEDEIKNAFASYFEDIKQLNNNDKPPKFDDHWLFNADLNKSVKNADAILILTEWEEYKEIDWDKISKLTKKAAWVFDTRLIVDNDKILKTNLNFWCLGKKNSFE